MLWILPLCSSQPFTEDIHSNHVLSCASSPQRSGPSWWSSRNVWTSRQTWGSSCCRTSRTSSGRSLRSRWNILETWRNWPSASWPKREAPKTTSNTSKETLVQLSLLQVLLTCLSMCVLFYRVHLNIDFRHQFSCHILSLYLSVVCLGSCLIVTVPSVLVCFA